MTAGLMDIAMQLSPATAFSAAGQVAGLAPRASVKPTTPAPVPARTKPKLDPGQAKAVFDGLLRDRLAQTLADRQLFNRYARLGTSDAVAARAAIFEERPDLRDAMIREANEGRGRWGLRPPAKP